MAAIDCESTGNTQYHQHSLGHPFSGGNCADSAPEDGSGSSDSWAFCFFASSLRTFGSQYKKHQIPPTAGGIRPQNTANILSTNWPELSGEVGLAAHTRPLANSATPITWTKNAPVASITNQVILGMKSIPTAARTRTINRINPKCSVRPSMTTG